MSDNKPTSVAEENQAELLPCPWCQQQPKLTKIKGSPTNPELVGCDTPDCPIGHCLALVPDEWNTRIAPRADLCSTSPSGLIGLTIAQITDLTANAMKAERAIREERWSDADNAVRAILFALRAVQERQP